MIADLIVNKSEVYVVEIMFHKIIPKLPIHEYCGSFSPQQRELFQIVVDLDKKII